MSFLPRRPFFPGISLAGGRLQVKRRRRQDQPSRSLTPDLGRYKRIRDFILTLFRIEGDAGSRKGLGSRAPQRQLTTAQQFHCRVNEPPDPVPSVPEGRLKMTATLLLSAVPPGLLTFAGIRHPAMNRWAIVDRPSGSVMNRPKAEVARA
jgi:hypothetical protein